jgi:hypothetical protein
MCLRRAVRSAGPVIITGERGIGRTTTLDRALQFVDAEHDQVVRLLPAGDRSFAALRTSFPGRLPPSAMLPEAVRAIAGYAGGRRLVVAADDAHLVDHASLLALRELSRRRRAVLLVTRPLTAGPPDRPDPSECLSYEPGVQVLILQPLSAGEVAAFLAEMTGGPVSQATAEAVHAATGGIPRLLRALVAQTRLAERMAREPGGHLSAAVAPSSAGYRAGECGTAYAGSGRLIGAAWEAWRDLAVPRAQQLCQLALCCGIREQIAPIWAVLLLFQADAAAASDFLESFPEQTLATTPELALVKALTLALGLGRTDDAIRFLSTAAERGRSPALMRAAQAWLLAVVGQVDAAARALQVMDRNDHQTAVFVHATRAALTGRRNRRAETVFHLRRALASAESGSDDFPWMRPYLKASLIDALMLSGRETDAVSLVRRFHAREPGAGWDLAVALNALLGRETNESRCSIPA